MQPTSPRQPQRPLTFWGRGWLWIMFVGSCAGLASCVYSLQNLEVARGFMGFNQVLFVASAAASYFAIYPKRQVELYRDFSFSMCFVGTLIFVVAVLAHVFLLWTGEFLA